MRVEDRGGGTDAAKAKVWDAYVEPYGQAKVFGTPSAGLNIRLPGQFLEAESGGLHQNWFRNYDPTLGRYVEADPLGIDAGQNPYGYVDGDPLDASDPQGLVELNLFNRKGKGDNPTLHRNANSYNGRGYEVAGHGAPNLLIGPDGKSISAAALAGMISRDPRYTPGSPVTLYSCRIGQSAKDGRNFGQSLANALGAPVIASSNYTFIGYRTKPVVVPKDASSRSGHGPLSTPQFYRFKPIQNRSPR